MENQLAVIVQESGLEQTKAKYLLDNFSEYFRIADEWAQKAKMIVVTSENQVAEMQMARIGRLLLREKRIAIEKARKELKEQSLREGKAIDGIANVLKALIVPIEEYLDKQEKYIEYKKAAEEEAAKIAAEKKAEEERLAREQAEREEQERIRKENARLKKEAEEREAAAAKERAEAAAKQKAIEEKAEKERKAADAKLRAERERAEAEKRAAEEKARKERAALEEKAMIERAKAAKEKARLQEETRKAQEALAAMIECPFCHKKFSVGEI